MTCNGKVKRPNKSLPILQEQSNGAKDRGQGPMKLGSAGVCPSLPSLGTIVTSGPPLNPWGSLLANPLLSTSFSYCSPRPAGRIPGASAGL